MSKIKYNKELLKIFCETNNIILSYVEHEIFNCNIKLTGNCINLNCDNTFNKKFHILYKTKVFTCKPCTNINGMITRKNTFIQTYGTDKLGEIVSIQNKKKETLLQKYGVDCILKNRDIINQIRKTNQLKYFNKNNKLAPSLITKEEQEKTMIDKYGSLNFRSSEYIKNKVKETVMNKYGVDHISKCNHIKELKQMNSLKKYGVLYPIQNPEIAEKCNTNGFLFKKYILPSGNEIKIQGYEHFALNYLFNNNINEDDIITSKLLLPAIWYSYNGTKHRHFVDIYIKSQNKCIEVKSEWTVKKPNVFLKQEAAKEMGLLYEIWVFGHKGNIINKFI
jgi:hypothetical protein